MSKEKIVAVKGMTMPEACYLCEFFDYNCYSCRGIPFDQSFIEPEDFIRKRADFCPLIEVEVEVKIAMTEFKIVAIKDFEMPDCCWNCKMLDGFESSCSITREFLDAFDMKKKRGDMCPLTEVTFYGKDLNG